MKCRRVERMIPLYVEGDLQSRLSEGIASHLEWCGRCNWLADEYRESQNWLRSSEPPVLDDKFLGSFKAGVLRQIEVTASKPSRLSNLIHQWSRRQVFALSAAMLIVFGVVVLYVYQARISAKRPVVEAANTPADTSPPSAAPRQAPDTETATAAGLAAPHQTKHRSNIRLQSGTQMISKQTFTPPFGSQINPLEDSTGASVKSPDILTAGENDPPDMLRIEIQTSDPNIRIIWFAPKEVDSPKTNQ
jgi:anti-sigma factor RsiW